MYPLLALKAGREASVGFHHPWIFSGALADGKSGATHGDVVQVADRQGRIIGTGTFSVHGSIAVRVLEFGPVDINEAWFEKQLRRAQERRQLLGYGPLTATTGYRVVFGEADSLPGLVIDRYGEVLVLQISTAGMDNLRHMLLAACQKVWPQTAFVERSDMPGRKDEGLGEVVVVHQGSVFEPVAFQEHDLTFLADVLQGQKTGFFLDQKDLRQRLMNYAHGKTVLNLFSYTGASSVAALKAGATSAHNVDESAAALRLCASLLERNCLSAAAVTSEAADIFQWLGSVKQQYDMVLLDPPALIKSKSEIESGSRAYHFLNRAALRLVKPNGIFVTSSCSHFFSEADLLFTLRRAAVQVGLQVDILESVRQAPDHPLSIYFPESLYLQSFICRVGA